MNYHHQKGIRVSHATRSAKAPSRRIGRALATRGRLSDADGSGAPSSRRTRFALAPLLAVLALLALALSTTALAAPRPLEGRLTEADGTTPYPFSSPAAVTVDSSNNVWVTTRGGQGLLKFAPAGSFLAPNDGTGSCQ